MAFIHIVLLCFMMITAAEAAEVQYLKKFLKVQNVHLKDGNSLMEMKANADTCSKICFEYKRCLSFDVNGSGPSCKVYSEDSRDRRIIKRNGTDFYQLVRVDLSRAEYESCPIDVVYEGVTAGKIDLHIYHRISATECLNRCASNPKCISVDYSPKSTGCYLSKASSMIIGLVPGLRHIHFYINRTRWNDFTKSHEMEDLNSVGCGIREFESYFVSQGKQKEGSSITSSYSLEMNPFTFIGTEAVFSTESRIQCASSCSLSETCVAFSYSKNTCTLKKKI